MRFRGVAIGLVFAVVASVFVIPVLAAPPQPYNLYGVARDAGAAVLPFGTRITSWVDGVDYSNGTSVYDSAGHYDVDTAGDWVTGIGQPNTPEVKEGGNVGDEIMIAAGDMTGGGQIFTVKKFWTPADTISENPTLAVNQPVLLKIARITTRPADLGTQYLRICNPSGGSVNLADYTLQKDTVGSYNGPTHSLSGTILGGSLSYVNLNGALTLVTTGDNLKLLWNNPGGTAFGGSPVIIDRVEFNQTGGAGTLFWEPGNTIMSDAVAPGLGQEIRRNVGCGDTNNNSVDFTLAAETGRPGANPEPTVAVEIPNGGESWTGGTSHGIRWTMGDNGPTLNYTVEYSWDNRASWGSVAAANDVIVPATITIPWLVPLNNTVVAFVRVCVVDLGGLPKCDESDGAFEIDSAAPVLVNTNPLDNASAVDPNTNVILTFSEGMNQSATEAAVSFTPPIVGGVMNTWNGAVDTLTINPNNPLVGGIQYNVTVACTATDDSDTGNALASCPRIFRFTTNITDVAPTVDLTYPDGGQRFSGGSSVTILYDLTDPDTALLSVDIHYSSDGGASWNVIAVGLSLAPGPQSQPWTTPLITSSLMRVRVCASDGVNPAVCDMSSTDFAIDSIRPTVIGRIPAPNSENVTFARTIVITFSETMARTPTQSAVNVTGTPAVSGIVFTWSQTTFVDDTLTLSHNLFASCTSYTVNVQTTARDTSTPGNTLAAIDTWSFDTACQPTVAISAPAGGEVWTGSSNHDVTFTLTDGDATVRVWVNITTPSGVSTLNGPTQRAAGPGGTTHTVTVLLPGVDAPGATIRVTAQDSTGLDGFLVSNAFTIDATAPDVDSSAPTNSQTGVSLTAPLTITFSEPMNQAVTETATSLVRTGVPGTIPLTFSWTGNTATVSHPTLRVNSGYTLTVLTTAEDASDPGNALAPAFSIQFTTTPTSPLSAAAGADRTTTVGSALTFNGSGSTPASSIVRYEWTFFDPSNVATVRTGLEVSFTFTTLGSWRVVLNVTDAAGNFDTDEAAVTVNPVQQADFLTQYWWLILVLIAAILGAILFLVLGRRRKKPEAMPPEVPPETVETVPPSAPSGLPPPPPSAAPAKAKPSTGTLTTKECPTCGTLVNINDTDCFMCGTKL